MADQDKKPEADAKKKAPKAEVVKKEPKKAAAKKPAAEAASTPTPAAPTPAPAAKSKGAVPKSTRAPEKTVKVTQVRSPAGRYAYQRATLRGLGLDRINRSSVLEDTPAVRGMIERVRHLVRIDPAA